MQRIPDRASTCTEYCGQVCTQYQYQYQRGRRSRGLRNPRGVFFSLQDLPACWDVTHYTYSSRAQYFCISSCGPPFQEKVEVEKIKLNLRPLTRRWMKCGAVPGLLSTGGKYSILFRRGGVLDDSLHCTLPGTTYVSVCQW